MTLVPLGEIVEVAPIERAGDRDFDVLSMTRSAGLVPQEGIFSKSVASRDLTKYKVVRPHQLVVGIHIDEGALGVSGPSQVGVVSPAYTLWNLSAPQRVLPEYLDRFIRSPRAIQYFIANYRKTADRRGKLTRERFLQLNVPLPPIEEQRRIAAVLDAAEELRTKRRRALAKLDTLTQAIFIDMFGGEWDRWPFVAVESLAQDRKGAVRTGPFGSQLLHEEFVDEGIAVLGIDNAVTNEFKWGERRYITQTKYEQLEKFTVYPGDVLVTIMGTCGRVAIVPDDIPTAINTKHLCCTSVDAGKCLPEWLWGSLLFHPRVLDQLGATFGAVMPGLNMGKVKGAEVPVPPMDVQRQFAARRQAAIEHLNGAGRSADELDTLFASLQQRAFSGEL